MHREIVRERGWLGRDFDEREQAPEWESAAPATQNRKDGITN
jgi:hypothetical protein